MIARLSVIPAHAGIQAEMRRQVDSSCGSSCCRPSARLARSSGSYQAYYVIRTTIVLDEPSSEALKVLTKHYGCSASEAVRRALVQHRARTLDVPEDKPRFGSRFQNVRTHALWQRSAHARCQCRAPAFEICVCAVEGDKIGGRRSVYPRRCHPLGLGVRRRSKIVAAANQVSRS